MYQHMQCKWHMVLFWSLVSRVVDIKVVRCGLLEMAQVLNYRAFRHGRSCTRRGYDASRASSIDDLLGPDSKPRGGFLWTVDKEGKLHVRTRTILRSSFVPLIHVHVLILSLSYLRLG